MTSTPIPEQLEGEPSRGRASPLAAAVRVTLRAAGLVLLFISTSWLWPLYLIGVAIWGRPPIVPRLVEINRYLRLVWTADPPAPGLRLVERVWLTLLIATRCVIVPIWGGAWLLDEALYGPKLRDVTVAAPIIEISAARSGSTQIARYLEADPHLAAPSFMQFIVPFLWLWRLVPPTIGRLISAQKLQAFMESNLPQEMVQRHELDVAGTDTFDHVIRTFHLNHLAFHLGPEAIVAELNFTRIHRHNRALWEEDFVATLDRIARKTLLHAGSGPGGAPRRFFVKGHFLCAADALEQRYPDARFLTMVRKPGSRLQSVINFERAHPSDAVLGPTPWSWLSTALVQTEIDYCDTERVWFSREGGARRCVVRFSHYLQDLEGAMTQVYEDCLDTHQLPATVPRVHLPRERKCYLLNRSLAQLAIDEEALDLRLADYIAWCGGSPRLDR